jgi:hypothetical protein
MFNAPRLPKNFSAGCRLGGAPFDQIMEIGAEGCLPSVNGAKVRRDKEKLTVTDGPFTETKEVVGGFALLHANSKGEAIELLKVFLKVAGDGERELRELYPES